MEDMYVNIQLRLFLFVITAGAISPNLKRTQ